MLTRPFGMWIYSSIPTRHLPSLPAVPLTQVHPLLPSFSEAFTQQVPLTRIRDIAHRNDIPHVRLGRGCVPRGAYAEDTTSFSVT
jgi:hypothetical protein